jgi:hypothetical protein
MLLLGNHKFYLIRPDQTTFWGKIFAARPTAVLGKSEQAQCCHSVKFSTLPYY